MYVCVLVPHPPFGARSFTIQYILADAYLEVGPARPSFWECLNLSDWWAAVAHPEQLLQSDRFKTSATYGTKLYPCTRTHDCILQLCPQTRICLPLTPVYPCPPPHTPRVLQVYKPCG